MFVSLSRDCTIVEDGSIYPENKIIDIQEYSELFDYSKSGTKVQFVGFIIKKEEMIVSFPKNYGINKVSEDDIKLLAKLLIQRLPFKLLDNSGDMTDNFPLESYLNVCRYYIKYGLYKKTTNTFHNGYGGKINWSRTVRLSNKLVIDGKLLLFPFVVENKFSTEVFITECMIEVLSKGYERFGSIFNIGVPFHGQCKYDILSNSDTIIKTLQQLLPQNNNDEVKKLIISIVDFIKWQTSNQNVTLFATKTFDYIWQNMVDYYLNKYLKIEGDSINFDLSIENNNKFSSEFIHKIYNENSEEKKNFSVRYDHILLSDNHVFLFDSKYYTEEILDLNYKQLSYHFLLKDWLYRTKGLDNISITNGLVLPTSNRNYEKIHIDTTNNLHHPIFRDVLIKEYYLNMKEVICKYLNFK